MVQGTKVQLGSNPHGAGSADTFTYLWTVTLNNTVVPEPNETSPTFSFMPIRPSTPGTYKVTLAVTNDGGKGLAGWLTNRQSCRRPQELPLPGSKAGEGVICRVSMRSRRRYALFDRGGLQTLGAA